MENNKEWYEGFWFVRIKILLITLFFCLISTYINSLHTDTVKTPAMMFPAFLAMFVDMIVIMFIQQTLEKIPKWPKLPIAMYAVVLNTFVGMDFSPVAPWVIKNVGATNMMAICTPVLAYAGISIGKDIETFKKQGIGIVICSIITFVGTFLGSTIVADIVLKATGADLGW